MSQKSTYSLIGNIILNDIYVLYIQVFVAIDDVL